MSGLISAGCVDVGWRVRARCCAFTCRDVRVLERCLERKSLLFVHCRVGQRPPDTWARVHTVG